MIKLQKMTPKVYYDQSRDFQFIGRLYDIVLNSAKTNADLIAGLPLNEAIDNRLLDLLTMTLGFKSLHSYNLDQLKAICSAFSEIIRAKGSILSIAKACTALVNAEGITEEVVIEDIDYKNNSITIKIPEGVKDISLLKDLLDYILPAGMTYSIVKALIISKDVSTSVATQNTVKYAIEYADRNAGIIDNMVTTDATAVNKNKSFNIPGVTINSAVVGSSNMCKIELQIESGSSGKTFEFVNGRNWYTIGEPIRVKTNAKPNSIYYKIGSAGNAEPVNYTKVSDTEYIVNITKSSSWDWYYKTWTPGKIIYLIATFN